MIRTFILALTVVALPLATAARASTLACEYSVMYFPERKDEKIEINKKGQLTLDTANSGFILTELRGQASDRPYALIGKALEMTNGIQISFGLYTDVVLEENGSGYTAKPLATAITLFGAGQKEIHQIVQAPDAMVSLKCER